MTITTERTMVVFSVPGPFVQEGNVSFGKGHSYHREGKALKGWRMAVAVACREQFKGPLWTGPVEVCLYFTYKARKKADDGQWKTTRPDIEKLARAVLDALTGVLYEDDKQVAHLDIYKKYGEWFPASDGGADESYLNVNAMRLS